MRILHINTEKTWRGGEQQTLNLIMGLKQQNIESHLFCQSDSPLADRAKTAGICLFTSPIHGEVDPVAIWRLRKLIQKNNYNIIHSHTSHAHTLAFLASLCTNSHRLVTRRVDYSIFRHSFLHLSGIKYRYMADSFIAVSHKIKQVMANDGIAPDRIFVVHSGINPARFESDSSDHLIDEFNIKDNEKVIVNAAHLAEHKGQKYLVKAIPAVIKKIPSARFFIVGEGELMGELVALAETLKLGNKLIFTGFRNDVGAFYKICDLFVMSSLQEGLGTSILDALAIGKPVVATHTGGIPEIITDGQTGRLVLPANPDALAEGIIESLENATLANKMAMKGKKTIWKNFSIDAMVDKNIKIYKQIITTSAQ
jgi:glycosyltransferase involved in cell wall biosynthesis